MVDNKKNIILRVNSDFYQDVNLYATVIHTTLQECIIELIRKNQRQKIQPSIDQRNFIAVYHNFLDKQVIICQTL